MNDELIYQYATTGDEVEAYEILLLLVAHYLSLYQAERDEYAEENRVDLSSENDEYMLNEYALYLTDIFVGLRERTQEKEMELTDSDQSDLYTSLHEYVISQYETIEHTETDNASQLAQLYVAQVVSNNNSAAKVKKKWIAHPDCCVVCKALNGTTKPVNEPFLVNGQVVELGNGKEFTYNYKDKFVAIAHPNCKCRIDFIVEQ